MLTLEELGATAQGCTRCALAGGRTRVVFGSGDPHASLMFVGEGPGAEEDRQGLPFVGRSGQLLDRILLEELGMTRDHCYIANVVKCRPPDNRDPRPEEIEACRPYLEGQVAAIRPDVVVTLGRFAAQVLLGTTEGINRLRGRAYPYRTGVLIPTLHPAAVLRGGAEPLAKFRADLVRAKLALDGRTDVEVAAPDPGPRLFGDGAPHVITVRSASPARTRALATSLAALLGPGDVVVLVGDLGAGKTVFAQGVAAGLGVAERVTSPTYTLVHEYRGRLPVHHVDVYRLEHTVEAADLGLAELVDSDGVTLVEWGDVIRTALGPEALEVELGPGDDDEERVVVLRPTGPGWLARASEVATAVAGWGAAA